MTLDFDPTITIPLLFNIVMVGVVWVRTRGDRLTEQFREVAKQFKTGSDRMDRHEVRLTALEQSVRALPSKDSMHRLEMMVAEMSGELKAMNAGLDGYSKILNRVEAVVSRHEQHLLDGKG